MDAAGQLVNLLLSIFASDILPIFVVAGVGFLLARFFEASVKTLSRTVFNALVPCLVFNLLVTSQVGISQFGRTALFCVLVTAAIGLVARLVAVPLRLDRPESSAFLLAAMFSNSGNFGLPLVLFAFGREALSHATVYFVTSNILVSTVGVFLAATGRRSAREALVRIVRVPAIYAVAAAALVSLSGVSAPLGLTRAVALLSDAALPVMLLVLGMQLERSPVPERPLAVGAAVVLSLLLAPILALGLAWSLALTGAARQAVVIQASMPTAVVTTVLALEFNLAPTFVTSAVLISTLLSPLTLTLLIAYLQRTG